MAERYRRRSGAPVPDGGRTPVVAVDPLTGSPAEVRRIQPYQARKTYLCPGCMTEVLPGVGHVVVVPLGAADLRRHWHLSCWAHRGRRRPGRA
jgi:hypothetical protein